MRRRVWFDWHSWLGLTTGLMLFVVCWSGATAVFSYEIDWLLNPAIRAASTETPIPWQDAYSAVAAARPDWHIVQVSAPRYPGFAIEVLASPEPDVLQRVYVDPVTTTVLGDTSYFNVQRFFRSFHMALFQPAFVHVFGVPIGYFVVAILSLPLLASLVTALVFYRRWWQRLWKLERRRGWRIFWSDLHKLVGLWSLWFVALISITGIWYLVEWWVPVDYPPPESANVADRTPLPIDALVAAAMSINPSLSVQSIGFPNDGDSRVWIWGYDGTPLTRAAAYVTLNRHTAEVLSAYSPGSGMLAWITDAADPLHFGTFGGLWSQAVYFLFGLGLCALSLSGAYLHVQRVARAHGKLQLRKTVFVAYGITVALLVMAAASGWSEIRSYGIGEQWPNVAWPVTLFVTAWCGVTIAVLSIWLRMVR